MGYGTAIAYGIILVFSPFPNIAIISYYNEKPLLTKVIVANVHLVVQEQFNKMTSHMFATF